MKIRTLPLTRRLFSMRLAASGLVLATSHATRAEDSVPSEDVPLITGFWPEGLHDRDQEGQKSVVCSDQSTGSESYGQVSLERRSRDGRPPSEWLRSMEVEELRAWLAKVEVSQAGVHGMTFWTHLTRDHLFRPLLIKGLTELEQAKLHAAAHDGY